MAILDFHFMAGTPSGIDYFTERHEVGLFSHEAYMSVFEGDDMEVMYDPEGLMRRGLYTVVKSKGSKA